MLAHFKEVINNEVFIIIFCIVFLAFDFGML